MSGRTLMTATVAGMLLLFLAAEAWTADVAAGEASGSAATDPVAADDAKKKEHRDAARKVAWASMLIVLVLIIFVVFLMLASRRLRSRYLGWHRKVHFKKMWDVWWSKDKPERK